MNRLVLGNCEVINVGWALMFIEFVEKLKDKFKFQQIFMLHMMYNLSLESLALRCP